MARTIKTASGNGPKPSKPTQPTRPRPGPKPTKPQPYVRNARGRGVPGHFASQQERVAAQDFFLERFKQFGNISAACRMAGIDRSTFYRWKEEDGAFLVAYKYAEEEAADHLDLAARQRAVTGVERVVVSMGKIVMVPDPNDPTREIPLTQREYSDAILLRMLQAHHPKYRNSSHVDVTSGGERLQHVNVPDAPEIAAAARAYLAALTNEKYRDSSGRSW